MTEANLYHQKILLTGASGFVGSAIRIALQSAGAEVVGVSRSGIGGTRARQVAADSDWTDLLEGVTCVVHAAAVVHFLSDKDRPTEQVYRDVNVDGFGMRRKTWACLYRDSKARPILQWTERSERNLDSLFVITADIRVNNSEELFNGHVLPISGIV